MSQAEEKMPLSPTSKTTEGRYWFNLTKGTCSDRFSAETQARLLNLDVKGDFIPEAMDSLTLKEKAEGVAKRVRTQVFPLDEEARRIRPRHIERYANQLINIYKSTRDEFDVLGYQALVSSVLARDPTLSNKTIEDKNDALVSAGASDRGFIQILLEAKQEKHPSPEDYTNLSQLVAEIRTESSIPALEPQSLVEKSESVSSEDSLLNRLSQPKRSIQPPPKIERTAILISDTPESPICDDFVPDTPPTQEDIPTPAASPIRPRPVSPEIDIEESAPFNRCNTCGRGEFSQCQCPADS